MNLSPILIHLGPLAIRWYGLLAATALVASFFYIRWLYRKINQSDKINIDSLFFWSVFIGLIGARLYHVLNELPYYLAHPALGLAIWRGGLAIHGGLIAGTLVLLIWTKRRFLATTDIFAPAVLLMLAIARWGNYFNQELFGRPTNLPWGIFIDPAHRPAAFASFTRFHPTFLYESLWCGLALVLITLWIKKRPLKKPGLITGVSLIAIGLGRLLVELLRVDQVPVVWGARLPLIVSSVIIIAGLSLVYCILYTASCSKYPTHNT